MHPPTAHKRIVVSYMADIGVLLAPIQDIGTDKSANMIFIFLKASYRIINICFTHLSMTQE